MAATGDGMRRFWDERARENAAWYVDTSLAYDDPDMVRFFEAGREISDFALTRSPVQPERHERALEIGPGLGRVCVALAEHFDHVTGIDVSQEMVERARTLIDHDRIELLVGDGVTLQPVPDRSVDFVVSFTVLQHLPSTELVLGYVAEAARVLRPGGVLALQWNNLPRARLWKAQAAAWRLQARLGLRGQREEQRIAREFAGTRVPWPPVERTLTQAGLQIRGRSGEGTLFSWVWATH
jgi:SAM-dependent methyltransferase